MEVFLILRIVLYTFILLFFVACGPTTEELNATASAGATATKAAMPTDTPTPEPLPDPEIGEALFNKRFLETSGRPCHYCHKVNENDSGLISLIGIATTAAERVEGMSAEEYIRQSILEPRAYLVEGFDPEAMPDIYGELMSEEEIDHLVAYLMTLN
jgi:mono/diheme cytochrome c family protein